MHRKAFQKWKTFLNQQPNLFDKRDHYFTWLILEIRQMLATKKEDQRGNIAANLLKFIWGGKKVDKPETPEERRARLHQVSMNNKRIRGLK